MTWVGANRPRPDTADKAAGRAVYIHDMSRPGMLYGKIKFSEHAHARIKDIDTRQAEALPGVKAVVTRADFATDVEEGETSDEDEEEEEGDEEEAAMHGNLNPGRYAVLSVMDEGKGIAPEVMDRIFDPFYTTKSAQHALGLGLTTCEALLAEVGGAEGRHRLGQPRAASASRRKRR